MVANNGEVELTAGTNPESLLPGAIAAPLVILDNLSIAGTADRFILVDEGFWELTFMELSTGAIERVFSQDFPVLPAVISGPAGNQKVTMTWPEVSAPTLGLGPAMVRLELRLKSSAFLELQLFAAPINPTTPITWTIQSGGPSYPIRQDPEYAGKHTLLTPLGDLIEDPVGTIGSQASGSNTYELSNFSVSQVFAFQRNDGSGLWGALLDPGGTELRRVAFRADVAKDLLIATQVSYMDGVYIDGTDLGDVPIDASHLFFASQTATFGVIEGDWWDVAASYRDYFEVTSMAAGGHLVDRTDIPSWSKDLQGVLVFPTGTPAVFQKNGQTMTLADHVVQYADHYGIPRQNLCVIFFGLAWTAGAPYTAAGEPVGTFSSWLAGSKIPDYDAHVDSDPALDYQALLLDLDAKGFRTGVYMLDSLAVNSSADWSAGGTWKDHGIVRASGEDTAAGLLKAPLTPAQGVLVCPSLTAWQDHLAQVAANLNASLGVDLIYLDNFIPTEADADFAEDNDHVPGYGGYQIEGYLDSLRAIVDSVIVYDATDPQLEVDRAVGVYTEAPQEFYAATGFMPPFMDFTDLVSEDELVSFVPLQSALYHDWAVMGPARAECFLFGKYCGGAYPDITDPGTALVARRSAQYAYALALVNGASLWVPELGVQLPSLGWGFEVDDIYGASSPLALSMVEMRGGLDFVGGLVRYRGEAWSGDYLRLGRRMRDVQLELFDDETPNLAQALPIQLAGAVVEVGGGINGVESNMKQSAVQGVWASSDGSKRGIVLVNYDHLADIDARATLDRDDLELGSGSFTVEVLDEAGTVVVGPFLWGPGAVQFPLDLDLPAEAVRLIEVRP
ncbi:DUF6259 domain-containing protein [Engelhardtia mirabilis]|uniref:DUF6259 domain-containing protein n=1 Tax=Engelhardtia mirabilis TaxID=2528011 RepID=UPI0011AAD8DE